MKIDKDRIVTIEYRLTDNEGNLLEESVADEEFAYLHGHDQLLEALEAELQGKEAGDTVQVSITPENGFGERDEEMMITVGRDKFPDEEELQEGLQVEAETDHGHQIFTIQSVDEENVTLDGNHPYAGYHLNFDVSVSAVREATPEELDHGHAHNGDHHH